MITKPKSNCVWKFWAMALLVMYVTGCKSSPMYAPIYAPTANNQFASDGSQVNVNTLIASSPANSVITLPTVTSLWGTNGLQTFVTNGDSIIGAGTNKTIINLAINGQYYGSGVIVLTGGSKFSDATINGATNTIGGTSTTPFSCGGDGWHITRILYNSPFIGGYFAYCAAGSGLADSNTIVGNNGSQQFFQIRGATNGFDTASSCATTNTVCIENNYFTGSGQAMEDEGSGRALFRHNILDGQLIVDAHQWETSVDVAGNQHGARQIECYDNTWTQGGFYDSLDILSGTGFIFNNHFPVDTAEWFNAGEYGAHTGSYAYTPSNVPVADQIGSGQHTQFAGKDPIYVFGNSQTNGADKTLQYFSVSDVSIKAWTNIQHDVNATFGMANMLVRNQDYFEGYLSVPFTGTGATNGDSVGVGSKSVMLTKTPSLTGAGYWVTNEGSWDTTKSANTSGQFYKWNGSSWVLFYTPLTYPYPLAGK